ncbi:CG14339 [Drosophila busckii]|uniref:CG14339 n=1 Tax=Drosophila busckii TaxID=30019 RepID=A0A0M4EB48_DROBS|nr:uncharacterized protein LOC108594537 [Drosophila busckii]ALC38585.1 CG14339 [Drosophila busckii]
MPPKKNKVEEPVVKGPLPPNIFLYIQLAGMGTLPPTVHPIELHLEQGDSVLVKCVEHYNTEGIIYEDEFDMKPTYTLIFQQDNLDRINHAADNPLLIKLFMRKSEPPKLMGEEEAETYLTFESDTDGFATMKENAILNQLLGLDDEKDEINYYAEKEELILLCVGYLDLIKVFGHSRCMIKEELYLYPVPEVPTELRYTVHSSWHLYTLVPIAKELVFTNMAFVTFESIYNLSNDYILDLDSLYVQLSFRSREPVGRNEYHTVPWCTFNSFNESIISDQSSSTVFESFRGRVSSSTCTGLKSSMEVQMHKLFAQIMRSEGLNFDVENIDVSNDMALVFNSFHRFILTRQMSETLCHAIICKRYVVAVDVWQQGKSTQQRVFQGFLDPAILCFPGVQNIRFAVELKYLGAKKPKPKPPKRVTRVSLPSEDGRMTTQLSAEPVETTFAIIKICLLSPLGEIYQELKVFRESFISQNRMLHCDILTENKALTLKQIQREAYMRFDSFVKDTVQYIIEKNVFSVEDKQSHFCCALRNLSNILLNVVGSDFNMRIPTSTNEEFSNLCVIVFNELEKRIHDIVEKAEDRGFDELLHSDQQRKNDQFIDIMNTIKYLRAVDDQRMADFLHERITEYSCSIFDFYDLIAKMEQCDYVAAREYFKAAKRLSHANEYYSGWIRLYLRYLETRDDPDELVAANATECLLKSIFKYAEFHARQLDGWVLLHCYYKHFNYAPGYDYARWRYEDQLRLPRGNAAATPFSFWGINLNIYPEFSEPRGRIFFGVFKMFVRLGIYEFGEIIFAQIQSLCSEAYRYMINTQLMILRKTLPEDYELSTFEFDETQEGIIKSAFNAQINGNVEYYRGNWEAAAEYYEENLNKGADAFMHRDNYLLSKLRLAYLSMQVGDYQKAIDAISASQLMAGNMLSLIGLYLLGKANYKLHNLEKAMQHFIECTTLGSHVPNAWGFLALIHLQLGNNMAALCCWKYAKVDPTKAISDDFIYDELDAIDIDSVELYVDVQSDASVSFCGKDDDY